MKKPLLSLALLCMTSSLTALAKDNGDQTARKAYVRVGLGYAFATTSQVNLDNYLYLNGSANITNTNTTSTIDLKAKKFSLGSGFKGNLAAGYWLHANAGVELGINIGIAPKKYDYDQRTSDVFSGSTYTSNTTSYLKLPIWLMPAVVLRTGGEKINLYSRTGIVIPVSGKLIMNTGETDISSSGTIVFSREIEITTRFAIGFHGALGLELKAGDRTNIFVEANGVSLNAYAKKGSLKKATANGMDQLPVMDVNEKEIEFEFDAVDTSNQQNAGSPAKYTTFSIPMSNFGIGAGVSFRL